MVWTAKTNRSKWRASWLSALARRRTNNRRMAGYRVLFVGRAGCSFGWTKINKISSTLRVCVRARERENKVAKGSRLVPPAKQRGVRISVVSSPRLFTGRRHPVSDTEPLSTCRRRYRCLSIGQNEENRPNNKQTGRSTAKTRAGPFHASRFTAGVGLVFACGRRPPIVRCRPQHTTVS